MTRPKRHQSSADVDAEIRRLEAERRRLLDAEDQRRGALIREYLSAPNGDALRAALGAFVSRRDSELFALDAASLGGARAVDRRPRSRTTHTASSETAAASTGI